MARRAEDAPRKHRQYTEKEREDAVKDVPKLGVGGAARKHAVPDANVSRWWRRHQREQHQQAAEPGVSAVETREVQEAAVPPAAPRRTVHKQVAETTPAKETPKKAPATTPATAPAVPAPAKPSARPKGPAATATAPARPAPVTPGVRHVAHIYTPSERAEAVEHAASHGVTDTSKTLGMSRFAIYAWQNKVDLAAMGLGPSPTSGPSVTEIEAQRDKEILDEWHRHPGLGPSQIRNQLRRKKVKVSVHTARRVMEGAGYRPPKVERHRHDERFEAVRPNHLWHLDFVHRNIHCANTFTLILLDDHSRYVVGQGVDDAERADLVTETFERAVTRHGKPEMVMHDRGSAFWSWKGISRFTALLTELGIDTIVAEDKELNGKLEVFNANLAKELFDAQRFATVEEMRRRLDLHIHWYNHGRTHHALGGLLVPADRYYGRVEEVLARIEAGAGRDLGDGLDLRTRCLDLFKVSSRDGVPEVWLLGKKLLELRP